MFISIVWMLKARPSRFFRPFTGANRSEAERKRHKGNINKPSWQISAFALKEQHWNEDEVRDYRRKLDESDGDERNTFRRNVKLGGKIWRLIQFLIATLKVCLKTEQENVFHADLWVSKSLKTIHRYQSSMSDQTCWILQNAFKTRPITNRVL